ncbi:uncharacterized protein Z519_12221 [Cladophialophora bantiana CBS 173.52]|uniref:Uncharacterized protein n=1 Tax=Cladophialophora bantiana (strain ATCC 10958 / CBS 173.52 / CDC B-1940 / NIH 8579) TaxID=1442370 RepID=A0A0D2H8B2_CLAB1|nr:uncharacterized protein Z519_12221 [Cladophialophora bantiana CBS 173.52]KIW87110.1 hypothetical protein Z519_12221 [Cladophialophora bantiana CBS 173.52]
MDPRHYLHLLEVRVDVRGSQIAILCEFLQNEPGSATIVFNFMDGRWSRSVEEPQRRLEESVKIADGLSLAVDPLFIHSIFFTSSHRWWMSSLSSINDQLITYEKRLQQEIDDETEASDVYSVINRALNSIAARLRRYASELLTAPEILGGIKEHHDSFSQQQAEENQQKYYRVSKCLSQICSHMKQVRILLEELEVKLKNILALLFNRMQIANDRPMVSNGRKMHSILQATREDSEISRIIAAKQGQIAEETQKDNVAMKTAFLAMPLFAQDDYLTNGAKVWVWVVCTVPSTCVAFAFYSYWRPRHELRKKNSPYAVTGHENGRVLQRGLA